MRGARQTAVIGVGAVFVLFPVWAHAAPIRAAVSVAPLATFVERVGAGRVVVQTLVRPGYNPELYEPTPRQIAALADAQVYLLGGVPLEAAWRDRIRAVNPDIRWVDVAGEPATHASSHGHDAHQDPHIWTSPLVAKRMARRIRDVLIDLDPDSRELFLVNFNTFAEELDALNDEIHTLLAHLEQRQFMVFHPAWGYFARAYNLTQVPIERDGKEPGPRALGDLISKARRDGIKLVMVQPQFARKAATRVARAIDARLVEADPLHADYVQNLRRVARLISEANGRNDNS